MELTIFWFPHKLQRVLDFVDMGAENTLLYENLDKFLIPTATIEGYGGRNIHVRQVPVKLCIGRLPSHRYQVYIFPIGRTFWVLMFCEAYL